MLAVPTFETIPKTLSEQETLPQRFPRRSLWQMSSDVWQSRAHCPQCNWTKTTVNKILNERGGGREGACAELGEEGAKYFFCRGRNSRQEIVCKTAVSLKAIASEDAIFRKGKTAERQSFFCAEYSWDIRDADVGISRIKTLCKWPFSVVLDTEWPGCPGIWVGNLGTTHGEICVTFVQVC